MALKKQDFVEIDYIATDKESNRIFDLTSEKEAKKNNIFNPKAKYKPSIICIGEHQTIPGLDKFLEGKEVNKEYTAEFSPEEGFGKKDAKLLKLVPSKVFKKENIRPFPGLQLNIDNQLGTVRTVSGGRVIVDFNHPLAGHNLHYKIKINKLIIDLKTKVESILSLLTKDPKVEIKEKSAVITLDLPDILQKQIKDNLLRIIPQLKEVTFKTISKQ